MRWTARLALGQLVDDYLAAHRRMMGRHAVGNSVKVEDRWRKLGKRQYLASVAAHCRKNGCSGRGIMHERVLARAPEGLERREVAWRSMPIGALALGFGLFTPGFINRLVVEHFAPERRSAERVQGDQAGGSAF